MTEGKLVRVLRIAEPCPAAWDEMSGTAAQRRCSHCSKTVHHLSAMDPATVVDLLATATPGGICVRVRCDRQGLVLHDAPTEPRAAQPRFRLLGPAVFGALVACGAPTDRDASALVPSENDCAAVVKGPASTTGAVHECSSDPPPSAEPSASELAAPSPAQCVDPRPATDRINTHPVPKMLRRAADPEVFEFMGDLK
jgi:hypothetical protein